MSTPREAVAAAISSEGPIRFDRFMELALYGPGGFYEDPPIGTGEGRGFATSPHVHPVFGQLLAAAIMELWDGSGRPEPLRLTEVGAGDGTLARQLLDAMAGIPLTYAAVERSPGARTTLGEISRISVHEQMPTRSHVVLAHELLDNLPFRRLRLTQDGPREVLVGSEGDRFVDVMAANEDVDLAERGGRLDEVGEETVVPVGAFAFLDGLADGLEGDLGYVLLIDYGAEGHTGGPVHGYVGHRLVEDVLADPGASDITSGVDFQQVATYARTRGFDVGESVTQRHALRTLGFDRWTREELERQAAHLDRREGMEAVRAWSGRQAASVLVDPTGLGRTRWLLLSRPGLAVPPWARVHPV